MPDLQLGYADRAQPSIVVPSHPSFDSSTSDSDESWAKRSSSGSDASCLVTPAYPNQPARGTTRTFLRKKKGEGQRATDEPVMLTLDFVSALFDMPLKHAAARIGMCPTSLKQACRKLGVPRWPFRATPRCPRTSSSSAPTDAALKPARVVKGASATESAEGTPTQSRPPPSARRPPARLLKGCEPRGGTETWEANVGEDCPPADTRLHLRRADWSAASCAAWSLADTPSPDAEHEQTSMSLKYDPASEPQQEHDPEIVEGAHEPHLLRAEDAQGTPTQSMPLLLSVL